MLFVVIAVIGLIIILRAIDNAAINRNDEFGTTTDDEVVDVPATVTPVTPTTTETGSDIEEHIASKANLIRIDSLDPGDTVESPLTVTGEARGTWYFEASFPITVVDWDGRIIGEGFATAQDEWMTENFVPFEGTIEFTVPPDTAYRRGAIIFRKDNPSGLPENDDALEIPVNF